MAIHVHIACHDQRTADLVEASLGEDSQFVVHHVLDARGELAGMPDESEKGVLLLVGLPRSYLLRHIAEVSRVRPRMAVVGLYDSEYEREVFTQAGLRDSLRRTDDFDGLGRMIVSAVKVKCSDLSSTFAST